ncbi:MAG: hypothetical protein ACQJCO_02185 [cyanobacterium endosymbiont of Rhopalodia sterrenbergii]
MSYATTSEYIVRHSYSIECPTNTISSDESVLLVNSTTCNHYRGYYRTFQCATVYRTNTGYFPSYHCGSLASYLLP